MPIKQKLIKTKFTKFLEIIKKIIYNSIVLENEYLLYSLKIRKFLQFSLRIASILELRFHNSKGKSILCS